MPKIDKNIFVSHIHEDDDDVGKLKGLLKSKGMNVRDYSVTKDRPNNATDENYIKREILKPRLDASSVLVVIISPDTKYSKYVDWEIEYAIEKEKRIVGVWENGSKGCEIPEALEKQYDSLVAWNSEKIAKAIEGERFDAQEDGQSRPYRSIPSAPC